MRWVAIAVGLGTLAGCGAGMQLRVPLVPGASRAPDALATPPPVPAPAPPPDSAAATRPAVAQPVAYLFRCPHAIPPDVGGGHCAIPGAHEHPYPPDAPDPADECTGRPVPVAGGGLEGAPVPVPGPAPSPAAPRDPSILDRMAAPVRAVGAAASAVGEAVSGAGHATAASSGSSSSTQGSKHGSRAHASKKKSSSTHSHHSHHGGHHSHH